MKLALLVANRGFFPASVIEEAYADMKQAFALADIEPLTFEEGKTKYNAVESTADGNLYHDFLELHRGEFDGLVICLPNFGDENGIKAAIRDLNVPILIQAYPDELGKMDFEHRRDAFCGKFALTSVLNQMGVKYTDYVPFTVSPKSDEFVSEIKRFAATCRVVKKLRHVRLGVIGSRTSPFKSVRFDETVLERHGIDVETFDLSAIMLDFNKTRDDDENVVKWKNELHRVASFDQTPDGKDLTIARFGAVLEKTINENGLNGIAIRCWPELQTILGITPCSLLGLLNHYGISATCETDISNTVAMLALSAASEIPAGCLDLNNNYGDEPDKCILFHCGPLPEDLMDIPGQIEDHKMLSKGKPAKCSWGQNVAPVKAGDITVVGARATNGVLAFFADEGRITGEKVDREFFGVYGVYESAGLQSKLQKISRGGFHHHANITAGHVADAIREALEKYLGYTYIDIQ
ncbi:MAG: hypothetical protein IKS28_05130 [Clostridia bacterium]|nr:hypothetical protein [Clostridia bacterium]